MRGTVAVPERAPRVCIVAHFAYGAMMGGTSGHAGGVERQTTMIARWLAGRGVDVSLVVWNEGQPPETMVDGVRVVSLCRQDAGMPGVRFFHPRWTSLNRALADADADVYYQNCAEYVTGQVAGWCRRRGRRFVFSVASDPECDPRLPSLRTKRERLLYTYGLRRADRIIVQTAAQSQMLRDGFGLDSVVLPMPCPALEVEEPAASRESDPPRIVWIGRLSPEKRLDLLLDIAAARRAWQFDVAGRVEDSPYARSIAARASELPNVRLLGHIERSNLGRFYSGATTLVCTSAFEGFPNTFLEAWSCGVPVVSLIDPDALLQRGGLGIAAADVGELLQGIDALVTNPSRRHEVAAAARAYHASRHLPSAALPLFERVLLEQKGSDPIT